MSDADNNLEQAIIHYKQALEVATRETYPELWAQIQFDLGKAYTGLVRGNRRTNLDQAIEYFQNALSIYTKEYFPDQWAKTQLYLGKAYSALAGAPTTDAPAPPKKKKDK